MVPDSPAAALGSHASGARNALVRVVRSVHDRFAEAHEVSQSKYAMGFGSQWRDLLDEAHDEVTRYGFQSHTLTPGKHKVPVINGCLVYVWRVPEGSNAVSDFAASPTRQSGFFALPLAETLFEPYFDEAERVHEQQAGSEESQTMLDAVRDAMPVVLVMVRSTPRQLQSIEWAVAEMDETTGKVVLYGQESIWEPELVSEYASTGGESFDSGTPALPTIKPREKEGTGTDAP